MQLITLLQDNTTLALVVFTLLGLCIGSFLNVVIHRIPLMMIYSWRQECSQFLAQQPDIAVEQSKIMTDVIANDTPIILSKPA